MQEKKYFIVCGDTCDGLDLYTYGPYNYDEAKSKLKDLYNDDIDSSDWDEECCVVSDTGYELNNTYSGRIIKTKVIDTTVKSI